ncbi:MAG: DUF6468 domain-containing protein [Pseudomonadota bacterium]|nr:DUF6468 domain-containing protein [Pseudomonadota bacterium]
MILDIMVMVLLLATIAYAIALNRRLTRFREGNVELHALVREMTRTVGRTEAAIAGLKRTACDAGEDLQTRIDLARALIDELQIITDSANGLADRLERAVSAHARDTQNRSSLDMPVASSVASSMPRAHARSRSEQELIEALETRKYAGSR